MRTRNENLVPGWLVVGLLMVVAGGLVWDQFADAHEPSECECPVCPDVLPVLPAPVPAAVEAALEAIKEAELLKEEHDRKLQEQTSTQE